MAKLRSSPVLTLRTSSVLIQGDRKPYCTFVLAYREPRKETDWDEAVMTFAADAAGLIIQSDLDHITDTAAE
jgi:hypothetical protein